MQTRMRGTAGEQRSCSSTSVAHAVAVSYDSDSGPFYLCPLRASLHVYILLSSSQVT